MVIRGCHWSSQAWWHMPEVPSLRGRGGRSGVQGQYNIDYTLSSGPSLLCSALSWYNFPLSKPSLTHLSHCIPYIWHITLLGLTAFHANVICGEYGVGTFFEDEEHLWKDK